MVVGGLILAMSSSTQMHPLPEVSLREQEEAEEKLFSKIGDFEISPTGGIGLLLLWPTPMHV